MIVDDPIWFWIVMAWLQGGDERGEALFWRGSTVWLLVVLFFLVNLFIMVAVFARPFLRRATDRELS